MGTIKPEPIAVIGSGCRLPGGVNSPSKFWEFLQDPEDIAREIPSGKFHTTHLFHKNANHHGSTNVTHAYLLNEDKNKFDHSFFNISKREAESVDPQQRALLEVVYESIEAAGYSIHGLRGSDTGVFVGQMNDDYRDIVYHDMETMPRYTGTGTSRAIAANRLSYVFDWHGPSMNIDTACSSSLVALHQAVQLLQSGESRMAVVAGVNLILGSETFVVESKLHMLSPSGRSHMWDADADGYARGEGVVAVVLKPLCHALADNDAIECVIRGTGVNQDGGSSSGLTVPSSDAQEELIEATYRKCGLDLQEPLDRCQYFEAHGTGTQTGDPREAEAIYKAFFDHREKEKKYSNLNHILHVGSVKTIVGHTEGAAGLTSLLKASLAAQHGLIPPNLHFKNINPDIAPFYHSNFKVPTQLLPWPCVTTGPRRVSINSFGFGGTNAHAIVESFHDPRSSSVIKQPAFHLGGPFVFSAQSVTALTRGMVHFAKMLEEVSDPQTIDLDNLAWTLQYRRSEFPVKFATAAENLTELSAILRENAADLSSNVKSITTPIRTSKTYPLRILGVFTGQGAQWPAMGSKLYKHSALFRGSILRLQKSLSDLPDGPDWNLKDELLAPPGSSRVHVAQFAQTLNTAVQIALVDLFAATGLKLQGTVGHSSGEIAAVYAAGILPAHHAIRVAYYRGLHLKHACGIGSQSGKMMAVAVGLSDAREFCKTLDNIVVAASNSKSSVTLSGDADSIEQAKEHFDRLGIFSRILSVDMAYHSPYMLKCYEPYLKSLKACKIEMLENQMLDNRPCQWYSSVYGLGGSAVDLSEDMTGKYWADNLSKPVLFDEAVERAIRESHCFDVVLEFGPHPALKVPTTETIKSLTGKGLPYYGLMKRSFDDMKAFSAALGGIWTATESSKEAISFEAFRKACHGQDATPFFLPNKNLPTYEWNYTDVPFWMPKNTRCTEKEPFNHLLGRIMWRSSDELWWRNILNIQETEWLGGHQFQGQPLFPASGYLLMAVEAVMMALDSEEVQSIELTEVSFSRAMLLTDEPPGVETTFALKRIRSNKTLIVFEYNCRSCQYFKESGVTATEPHINFTGSATVTIQGSEGLPPRTISPFPLTDVNLSRFYLWMKSMGLDYSNDFRVASMKRRKGLATVTADRSKLTNTAYALSPASLDSVFHGVFAAHSYPFDSGMDVAHLPSSCRAVKFSMSNDADAETTDSNCAGCISAKASTGGSIIGDSYLGTVSASEMESDIDIYCGHCGKPQIQIQGLICSRASPATIDTDRDLFSEIIWTRDTTCGWEVADLSECSSSPNVDQIYHELDSFAHSLSQFSNKTTHREQELNMATSFLNTNGERDFSKTDGNTHNNLLVNGITSNEEQNPSQIEFTILEELQKSRSLHGNGVSQSGMDSHQNDLLARLYRDGLGFKQINTTLKLFLIQMCRQFPLLRILEVGLISGHTTLELLNDIGVSFESFTFGDISTSSNVQSSKSLNEKFDYGSKVVKLDPNVSVAEQGLEKSYYDIIISRNTFQTTVNVDDTLKGFQQLLRPGGRLALIDFTGTNSFLSLIMSNFFGLWNGSDTASNVTENQRQAAWNESLKMNGFCGADFIEGDCNDNSKNTFSFAIAQSSSPRIQALLNPLTSAHQHIQPRNIVVIKGNSPQAADVCKAIVANLKPFASKITIISDLEDEQNEHELHGSFVLSLIDLGSSILLDLTDNRLQSLQRVFKNSAYILWVTLACNSEFPESSMIKGLGRSVAKELSELTMQFVDFDSLLDNKFVATSILNILVRAMCLTEWNDGNLLWNMEAEISIQGKKSYFPRVTPHKARNDRYNSQFRTITYKVPLSVESKLLIDTDKNSQLFLREEMLPVNNRISPAPTAVRVKVHQSSIFKFTLHDEIIPFYICVGESIASGEAVAAFSAQNASILDLPAADVANCRAKIHLQQMISTFFIQSLIKKTGNGILWVHNGQAWFLRLVRDLARQKSVRTFFSAKPGRETLEDVVLLHPSISARSLKDTVPCEVTVGVFPSLFEYQGLYQNVQLNHNSKLQVEVLHKTTQETPVISLHLQRQDLYDIMASLDRSICEQSITTESHDLISLDFLPEAFHFQSVLSVIDWQKSVQIPTRILPLQPSALFSRRKTYFLVGSASEVGISLIDWMSDHGARYFAVASRTPSISSSILQYWRRKGCTVRTFAFNIADQTALKEAYEQIKLSLPPVAGVANLSMVLRDTSFLSMRLSDMNDVLLPKVQGSRNLDQLFYSDNLEFFILFSSITSIVGNPGQSNYTAANAYMSALTTQRQRRGVAGSTIHIGILTGLGYVQRTVDAGSNVDTKLEKIGLQVMSESDLRTQFAEAIVAGRPNSKESTDLLITPVKLRPSSTTLTNETTQLTTERFSSSSTDLKKAFTDIKDVDELYDILKTALCLKLASVLQLSSGQIKTDVPLTTLGIDSLVAMEIRAWVVKALRIDIPLLKFLDGITLTQMCQHILHKHRQISSSQCSTPNTFEEIEKASNPHPSPDSKANGRHSFVNSISESQSDFEKFERVSKMGHAQARLFFLHKYLADKSALTIAYVGSYHNHLQPEKLQEAMFDVCMHHESLRSSFFYDEVTGEPMQGVNRQPDISFFHRRVSNASEVDMEISRLNQHAFEIESGKVWKIVVLTESPELHYIILAYHHIIIDGSSWPIFMRELNKAFSGEILYHPKKQLIDLLDHRRQHAIGKLYTKELKYWRDIHKQLPEPLPLPSFAISKSRIAVTNCDCETYFLELDATLAQTVREQASQIGVTAFHLYLAVFAIFISQCFKVDDICIGITDANRMDLDDESVIGYLVNMLPLRLQPKAFKTFQSFVQRCRDHTLSAIENSRVPFDSILDHLQIPRNDAEHPLFQVILNYRRGFHSKTPLGSGDLYLDTRSTSPGGPYDLALSITDTSSRVLLHLTTQKHLFTASDSMLLCRWFTKVLRSCCLDRYVDIANGSHWNRNEITPAISLGEGQRIHVDWEGTIIHRVQSIAREYPNTTAITDDYGVTMSYRGLMNRVEQLSQQAFQGLGHSQSCHVGILLRSSTDYVYALLATMLSGHICVPLDLRNPHKRLLSIVAGSHLKLILCSTATSSQATQLGKAVSASIVNVDSATVCSGWEAVQNRSKNTDVAVIYYTSGSTGTPKGVQLTHDNIVNYFFTMGPRYNTFQGRFLQQSSVGFDMSLHQIFFALANAGTLVIVGNEHQGDPAHIAYLMRSQAITHTACTPTEYLSLLTHGYETVRGCSSWRFAFCGGEKVTKELLQQFRRLKLQHHRLVNIYGPTETTIACAEGVVPYASLENTTNGSDFVWVNPNQSIFIADEQMHILPLGVPGQICIAGKGLSAGYLNVSTETEDKFKILVVPSNSDGDCTKRLYVTGDYGRLLDDGSLQLIGRIDGDRQVKIRGQRFELQEVASSIVEQSADEIVEAAASYRRDSELLIAFVVFRPGCSGDKPSLLQQLKSGLSLPQYMRPDMILEIAQIPISINGKQDQAAIDNIALPPSHSIGCPKSSFDVLTHSEYQLQVLWENILGSRINQIGCTINRDSEFFQSGGNSMLIVNLRLAIYTCFGVTIPLVELFQLSKFSEMAARIGAEISTSGSKSLANQPRRIDWYAEVNDLYQLFSSHMTSSLVISPSIIPNGNSSGTPGRLSVLLTGATGFLGSHILKRLVESQHVKEVYCVAIRPGSNNQKRHVSISNEKIIEYQGDLSHPTLGLSENDILALVEKVDVIIHNGATVSFAQAYHSLANTNVRSTTFICRLAIRRNVPIHFVSSASVARAIQPGLSAEARLEPLHEKTASAIMPPHDSDDGYGVSKWMSEAFLERVSENCDIPIWIHRPSNIVGIDAPELDVVNTFIIYSRRLQATPDFTSTKLRGSFDLISVEQVSKDLVATAIETSISATYKNKLSFVHHCGGDIIPVDQFTDYMENNDCCRYKKFAPDIWLGMALQNGLNQVLHDFLLELLSGSETLLPRISK